MTLVDPTATRHDRRAPASGLTRSGPTNLLLVDGMLNKGGNWGRGILDAVEALTSDELPTATVRRHDLDPLRDVDADLWASATLDGVDGMIVTAGDCITCTTRGVRCALAAEATGRPAVIICTAAVIDVVQATCATYGAQELPTIPIGISLFGRSRAEIAEVVAPELAMLPTHLVRDGA